MRVEIWTDIICPWCGLGNKRLEDALANFEYRDDVEVIHRSFQLDEQAPTDHTESVRDMLVNKKGVSAAQVETMTKRIESLAKEDGLSPYVVLENRVGNTQLAHELAAWATEQGHGKAMWDLLYKTYFGEAKSIFDLEALVALAPVVGLDADSAREALTSHRYAARVKAEGKEARDLGANGVPFVVIDRKYAVSGAQPVSDVLKALETAWRHSPSPRDPTIPKGGAICGPDGDEPS